MELLERYMRMHKMPMRYSVRFLYKYNLGEMTFTWKDEGAELPLHNPCKDVLAEYIRLQEAREARKELYKQNIPLWA
jgi:hypothetical protein